MVVYFCLILKIELNKNDRILKQMQSCLCDVHVEFIRKQSFGNCDNLKDWCSHPNNVYIGRAGILILDGKRYPEVASLWANPFKVKVEGELGSVLNQYFTYINERIVKENLFEELRKLKGKRLGCWCVGSNTVTYTDPRITGIPWTCHGQILLYLINYYFHDTVYNSNTGSEL